jgi:flagellar basal body-associated protein FliL
MSDDAKKKEEGGAAADAAPAKKGLPIKTIAIVVVVMIVEAIAVFAVVGMSSKKPVEAEAKELHGEDHADKEAQVEIPLIEEKFQNMSTGRVWVWDTSVVIKVKKKNEEFVTHQLEARDAEFKEGLSMIFRRAQHSQLKEPGLETLNRQLLAFVNHALGPDAEGVNRVERVLFPKCKGFPADF